MSWPRIEPDAARLGPLVDQLNLYPKVKDMQHI